MQIRLSKESLPLPCRKLALSAPWRFEHIVGEGSGLSFQTLLHCLTEVSAGISHHVDCKFVARFPHGVLSVCSGVGGSD